MNARSASLLLLFTSAYAGAPSAPLKATAAATAPASAGLLNDALRLQSDEFKTWDIGGQLRFRYELKEDAGSFPSRDFISNNLNNDNDYLLFREKLHIGWQPQSWFKVFVEGRGAQAASDERVPSPDQDAWNLHQLYIELGDPKLFPVTLKIGRQEMLYAEERFIGIGDWSNTGRSFDAVKLHYEASSKTWVDVFTGRVIVPRDGYLNESNEYDQFSGLYASSQELVTGLETQLFFLARNVSAGSPNAIATGIGGPTKRDVYTYGTRIKSLPAAFGGWDFIVEGAGQFGTIGAGAAELDLRSYMLNAAAGYTFDKTWSKPRLGLGWDYASGDSNATDGKAETFEPLFGTNHRFYGVMDLIGPRNLNSPRISFSAKPTKKLSVAVDYLLFWLADTHDSFYPEAGAARSGNGYGKKPQYDSFVGSELDIVAKYALTPYAEIHLGYGHFFPGSYIESSVASVPANGGATGADWLYVQTTFTF